MKVKRHYWRATRELRMWRDAMLTSDRAFRSAVLSEQMRPVGRVSPVEGETARRAEAAVSWLARAQDATPDGGVSYGYFPVYRDKGWQVSYPETTGYIMTSLLEYARRTGRNDLIERVHRMALWEAEVQMPNGAVQGGRLTAAARQTAAVFNTGMVLDGWVTLLQTRHDPMVLRAAERAAAFLVNDMTSEGLFVTNGDFVSQGTVKVYNVLCAWALARFGHLTGNRHYRDEAVRSVEGALRFQRANGWFADNCLSDPARPLTHTIGYAAQGVLEVGVQADREDFVRAAASCVAGTLTAIRPNGSLPGRLDSHWRPTVSWACLTGAAQIAIVAFRLSSLENDRPLGEQARRLVSFLKATQRIDTGSPGIDGALAGSYPIMGGYMTGGYPNWATKYLVDALMLNADHSGEQLTS